MKPVNEKLLFSLKIHKQLAEIGFNPYEAYTCLQLSQVSYLHIDKQRKKLKKYNFSYFRSFTKENTYAFICKKNDIVYITFRGTDFSNKNDILDDLDIKKVKEGVGHVHKGYKRHLDRVWKDILLELSKINFSRIVITGHSMGGAVGQIANYRLPGSKGYFFGSSRSVDSKIYKDQKSFIYHIQNEYDLVSTLPPKLLGFRLLGERYILKYGKLYPRTQSLFEIFYTIMYMIFFLTIYGVTKIFGVKDKIKNLLWKNHEIADYHTNLEAYIVEETFNILRYEKKIKKN